MRHFTVLVIGDDVEKQLAPYHEYECTGVKDEYVEWIDENDEVIKEYESHKDEYETIDDFAEEWFGYEKKDGRYGRFTNPNAQWDWWVIGGRWTGFFEIKEGCEKAAVRGKPSWCNAPAPEGTADQLRIGAVDWEKMKQDAGDRASKQYDDYEAAVGDITPPDPWDMIRERHEDIEDARAEFRNHPWNVALRAAKIHIFRDAVKHFECHNGGRETFVKKAINEVGVPYAFVKDGKWVAKGDMGWWGMSDDHHTQDEWNKQYHKMLSELDPETVVTLVDCHI
jgi:hypothetical protein